MYFCFIWISSSLSWYNLVTESNSTLFLSVCCEFLWAQQRSHRGTSLSCFADENDLRTRNLLAAKYFAARENERANRRSCEREPIRSFWAVFFFVRAKELKAHRGATAHQLDFIWQIYTCADQTKKIDGIPFFMLICVVYPSTHNTIALTRGEEDYIKVN